MVHRKCISNVIFTLSHFYNVKKNVTTARFRSLRTGPNLLILSLSGAGIMIVFMLPIFLVNLYYGGPVTGVLGAQVNKHLVSPSDLL